MARATRDDCNVIQFENSAEANIWQSALPAGKHLKGVVIKENDRSAPKSQVVYVGKGKAIAQSSSSSEEDEEVEGWTDSGGVFEAPGQSCGNRDIGCGRSPSNTTLDMVEASPFRWLTDGGGVSNLEVK